METTHLATLKKTYALLSPHLDERTRRLWCAAQASTAGHGGITANWRAVPRVSREVVVELIAHTTTEKGPRSVPNSTRTRT